MAKRPEKGSMGSFSRGSELWMHQARLLVSAAWTVFLISLVLALCVAVGYFFLATDEYIRYGLERNWLANIRELLFMTAGKMELVMIGVPHQLDVHQVASMTEGRAEEAYRAMRNGGLIGLLSGVGFFAIACLYWWAYGKEKMTDQKLRGSALVDGSELSRQMRARDDTSPYKLADVPMRKKAETLHTLIGGAQGTGKSQQFFALMKQVRAQGKRAIIYDPTGEFTAAFYREGKDILMNPLDARSPNWNIWNEIEKDYHFDNLAAGLIPDPAQADPFWSLAGRAVLKDVYRVLGREGKRTNRDLYNAIAMSNLESLHVLLAGTAGSSYVDPTTERTGMSLKMTVQNQLEAFRFLRDDGELFSIRRWIHEESDSWMFITARESMREALKPVLSLWADTVVKAVLDLEPIHRERLWLFLDELPTLQKLDVLKLALTNTRKYGLCCVVGVQDFSQLYEIYGHDLAKTIISGCQTKLLLRVTDGAAAKLLAELMGQAEVDEKEETLSYGLSAQRDGVSISARRAMRDIVLTSEILSLPDMTGYLMVPGDYPIARVAYDYVPTPTIGTPFQERDGLAISFNPRPPVAPVGGGVPSTGTAGRQGGPGLLDDLDDDEPVTEIQRMPSGEVVVRDTGEILEGHTAVSRAKAATAEAAAAAPKPANSLSDVL